MRSNFLLLHIGHGCEVHSPSVGVERTAEPGGVPTAATRLMTAVLTSRDVGSRPNAQRSEPVRCRQSARRARWEFGALAK